MRQRSPALKRVAAEAEEDGTPAANKARIAGTLETMQLFDDWYRDVMRLPRSVHRVALKTGGRTTRFLPKSELYCLFCLGVSLMTEMADDIDKLKPLYAVDPVAFFAALSPTRAPFAALPFWSASATLSGSIRAVRF